MKIFTNLFLICEKIYLSVKLTTADTPVYGCGDCRLAKIARKSYLYGIRITICYYNVKTAGSG